MQFRLSNRVHTCIINYVVYSENSRNSLGYAGLLYSTAERAILIMVPRFNITHCVCLYCPS